MNGRRRRGPHDDVRRMVEDALATPNEVSVHGFDLVVRLLRNMPAGSRNSLLDSLEERYPTLRRELDSRMFTFEDLLELDDYEFLRLIDGVRAVGRDLWPLSLKSCSIKMRDKVFKNMPAVMKDEVEYRIETMGRRRISQVHTAQRRIIQIAQELTEQGVLNFGTGEKLV